MIARRAFGRLALGLFAASALVSLGGCGDPFPDYNYKMTIHAGGKSFSSVRHVEQEEVSSLADSSGRTLKSRLTGEAVILDLNGRTYYALLSKPDNAEYATYIAGTALMPHVPKEGTKSEVQEAVDEYREEKRRASNPNYYLDDMADRSRAMIEVKGARDLPRTYPPRRNQPTRDAWPMFVTFGDASDPKTVRAVTPEEIGVDRITIEITDEEVTTGIEKRLPKADEKGFFNWDGKSNPNENGIFGIWDFIRGASK